MKKMICLALAILLLCFVFTGCGAATTTRSYDDNMENRSNTFRDQTNRAEDRGNVSTSRDGTVNGQNRSGSPDMGMDLEIGTNMGR